MPIETRARNNCHARSCLLLRTPESGRGAAGAAGGGSIGDRSHDKWCWQRRHVRRGGAVGGRCGGTRTITDATSDSTLPLQFVQRGFFDEYGLYPFPLRPPRTCRPEPLDPYGGQQAASILFSPPAITFPQIFFARVYIIIIFAM